jgi:hypothetical protein
MTFWDKFSGLALCLAVRRVRWSFCLPNTWCILPILVQDGGITERVNRGGKI